MWTSPGVKIAGAYGVQQFMFSPVNLCVGFGEAECLARHILSSVICILGYRFNCISLKLYLFLFASISAVCVAVYAGSADVCWGPHCGCIAGQSSGVFRAEHRLVACSNSTKSNVGLFVSDFCVFSTCTFL